MTNQKRILLELAKGRPLTYAQIAQATGLTHKQVCSVLESSKSLGYLAARPVSFVILPAGLEKASIAEPASLTPKPKRKYTPPVAEMSPNAIVASAKASRSPLESAWRSANA